jgi:hypothetical protein
MEKEEIMIKKLIGILIVIALITPVIAAGSMNESIKTGGIDTISESIGQYVSDTLSLVKEPTDNNTLYLKNTQSGISVPIAASRDGTPADKLADMFSVLPDHGIAVFHSWATNLVPAAPRGVSVYEKDLNTNAITLIKPSARFPAVSPAGRYIAYESSPDWDTVLPAVYLYDTTTGKETFVAYTSGGNDYGWTTQTFNITDTSVSYFTSYPYPGVGGFTERTYNISGGKS